MTRYKPFAFRSKYTITLMGNDTTVYIPVSHILNLECHQPAPLKDQSQILCTTYFRQQECSEQRDPESGEKCEGD